MEASDEVLSAALTPRDQDLFFSITARPGAKHEVVQAGPDGGVVIKIAAPAQDGKANARLVELLAMLLGASKSRITLIRGAAGREKTFRIEGLGREQALVALAQHRAA